MQPLNDSLVYVVDDDEGVREALAWLLRSRRLLSEVFESAEAFEAKVPADHQLGQPTCLLLDVRMQGKSGLALFEDLIARDMHLAMPVIFLTGHADVTTAVDAVKRGAFDFCEKPFSDNALVDRVEQALQKSKNFLQAKQKTSLLREHRAELTEGNAM